MTNPARHSRASLQVISLPILALLSFGVRCTGDGLAVEEIECDEALVHLVNCCEGGPLDVDCGYVHDAGCGGHTPGAGCPPELSLDESRLVQGLSCPDIRIAGYCSIDKIHGPRGSLRAQCIARDTIGFPDFSSVRDFATPTDHAWESSDGL